MAALVGIERQVRECAEALVRRLGADGLRREFPEVVDALVYGMVAAARAEERDRFRRILQDATTVAHAKRLLEDGT